MSPGLTKKGRCFAIILPCILIMLSCYKEQVIFNAEADQYLYLPTILKLNGKECVYDAETNTLHYSISSDSVENFTPYVEFQDYSILCFENIILSNKRMNNLGTVRINHEYDITVETGHNIETLNLRFTSLPIIQIITGHRIYDEPKTLARIVVNDPAADTPEFDSYIGIEVKGNVTANYPKKPFSFHTLNSMSLNSRRSCIILNAGPNSSWILNAMYTDPSRVRSKISFQLWNEIRQPDKNASIHPVFVELFINNEHQGLYAFGEIVNEELLHLSDNDAVLYKAYSWGDGATSFETCESTIPEYQYWQGWEQRYPFPDERINWIPLAELLNLVVNGDDTRFISEISSVIDYSNFIDYFLFVNLISATDNTGKNIFLVRQDQHSQFEIIPWDLDGSLGIIWDGSVVSHDLALSNNLYDRLIYCNPDGFIQHLRSRWQALRSTYFSEEHLNYLIRSNTSILTKTGIIPIESYRWQNFNRISIEEEEKYIQFWLNRVC